MSIPKQLISLLNSGKCIGIIGSGPSCEMGYPSWQRLAETCLNYARAEKLTLDESLFSRLMARNDYPKVFKYLEPFLTRSKLVSVIQSALVPTNSDGKTYAILAKWPFRFYMTTNWDSEINAHLSRLGFHFTTVSNSRHEITHINDDTAKQIVMVHGILPDPDSLVLTEDDYQSFKVADERQYFREALKSILRTLPAVVIGHSMADPDMQTILEAAKTIAPPHRPIYMIVADPHKEDIDRFHERYNIHLIEYKRDPAFAGFSKLLRHIDLFIVPRTGSVVRPVDPPPQNEVEIATSLLVFNSLRTSLDNPYLLDRFVYPQILQQIKRSSGVMRKEDVRLLLMPDALRTLPSIFDRLDAGFNRLVGESLIDGTDTNGWKLTSKGEEVVASAAVTQRFEDDQVYGSLQSRLKEVGVAQEDCDRAALSLKNAILSVFRKRGIAAASLVFRGQRFEPVDMAELFESITASVEWSESFELREAFIDFSVRLFSSPTEEERRYLARVSQGLFAVHVFGYDPVSVDARTQVFKEVTWLLDSNVLIHLLAKGSTRHEMASSICEKCRTLGIRLLASNGVVVEALKCLEWATNMCSGLQRQEEMQFIFRLFSEDAFRLNPFIDGFVASHQQNGVTRFAHYKNSLGLQSHNDAVSSLNNNGIYVIGLDELPSDSPRRQAYIQYKDTILIERERRGTSKGDFQAHVEAEVMCLLLSERDKPAFPGQLLERAYFVSTSRLLDHLFGKEHGTLTWLPDVLFRHLALISPSTEDADTIIESLGTELAELGVTMVDQEAYRRYFDPFISSSRLSFAQERNTYVEALKHETGVTPEELQREFESIPDIDKPRFVAQMHWGASSKVTVQLERELTAATQQQHELTEKLKAKENEWNVRQKSTVRHFENRIRNLSDPARRDKLMRKNRNKGKKRRREK